jgi:anti-sigma B factor antagonist
MRDRNVEDATITHEVVEDAVVVHISGQMREMGADALREELDQLIEGGQFKLIFDLGDVSFVSSTGLGQMMRAYRQAVGNGGYLRVVNPQPLVEEVFRFTKLHTLIGIFPTVQEALAAE